ncbi:MAG: hypothetical protein AAF203_08940 [Pseudomonadota bacterium]
MSSKGTAFRPKRIHRSIKLDRVQARDLLNYNLIYACEQCSHFDPERIECTLGFQCEPHLKENQLKGFSSHSHMAFCRFLEID